MTTSWLRASDLRRSEPDARFIIHRLEHVIDKLLKGRCLDFGQVNGQGLLPEHGIS